MNENRPDPEEPTAPDAWRLTRFFIPLAVVAGATATDVHRLIRCIEQRVFERFGVRLEREVRLVGDFEE